MAEDKSDEVRAPNATRKGDHPGDTLELPEVKQLQVKVESLEQVVESLKREMVGMRLRQYFIKAIIGWKEGEKAPLSKNKLKELRKLAGELGITV